MIAEQLAAAHLPIPQLIPVPLEEVVKELRSRAAKNASPGLAMVPVTALDRCAPLPLVSVHRFTPTIISSGAIPVLLENGETIGFRAFWDVGWFIGVTRLDPDLLGVLGVAAAFRDPRLPAGVVDRIQLLIHNQTLQLPRKLGGLKFELHFPGLISLKIERDPANPNRAMLTVLDITGHIPLEMLPFVAKLPLPSLPPLEKAKGGFEISLRRDGHDGENSGTLDYLTGSTQLSLSVRTAAPFLKPAGMGNIDVDIEESGHWDRNAGTFVVESGTVSLASGVFAGLKLILLASSKNQTRVETTSTKGWQAINVEIVPLGGNPSGEETLLDTVRDLLQKFSTRANRIAQAISLAGSISRARDVYVTYACIKTTTAQRQEMKNGEWVNIGQPVTEDEVDSNQVVRRQLPLSEALLWYQGANATATELQATLVRNRPRTGCN